MRSIISCFIVFYSFTSFAQRISFEDPDLTFSFKKPKNWEVFDDGYVVKVAPSGRDTAHTFFSITYFESPKPIGGFGLFSNSGDNSTNNFNTKIDKVPATSKTQIKGDITLGNYSFNKFGQRFEIVTSSRNQNISKNRRIFKNIIRSVRIKDE